MEPDDSLTQKAIDLKTGRDITGEYIGTRLKELEEIADDIIASARKKYENNPQDRIEIYQKAHEEIHQKLGVGSIGPATAAAGPLMYEKKDILADELNIAEEERLL